MTYFYRTNWVIQVTCQKVLSGNANEVCCSLCKRFSQQTAQKSDKKRQKRRQKKQRKKRAKRRKKSLEKDTRNLLSLILKSTYTLTQRFISYTRWGSFSKSPCNNIQPYSKNIKPRFHLELFRELLPKGYVDNGVIEDLQSLVHKLEKKTKNNPQKKHESNF